MLPALHLFCIRHKTAWLCFFIFWACFANYKCCSRIILKLVCNRVLFHMKEKSRAQIGKLGTLINPTLRISDTHADARWCSDSFRHESAGKKIFKALNWRQTEQLGVWCGCNDVGTVKKKTVPVPLQIEMSEWLAACIVIGTLRCCMWTFFFFFRLGRR